MNRYRNHAEEIEAARNDTRKLSDFELHIGGALIRPADMPPRRARIMDTLAIAVLVASVVFALGMAVYVVTM